MPTRTADITGLAGDRAVALPVTPRRPAGWDSWLLHLAYLYQHRRPLDLAKPLRFTELVQWSKLNDRDPRLPGLIDKVAVKAFVSDRVGSAWVTPTLWHGPVIPARPDWRAPFVVKSRHGCNQRRFVFDQSSDWHSIRLAGARWTRRAYGRWLAEWGYRDVPRGILVEPFVGTARKLPTDYKLYVFHGHVAAIQVHLDRATDHRWILLDPQWRSLSSSRELPRRPRALPMMIEAAAELAAGFGFVRVDFYDVEPHPRFGEMTFYPGSGFDPFAAPGIDEWLGALWRRELREDTLARWSGQSGDRLVETSHGKPELGD